jgi:mRNA interferase MazF
MVFLGAWTVFFSCYHAGMLKEILSLLDWLRIKILLRDRRSRALFKEGEIWWCKVGMNVGAEIFGKGAKFTRPVLVLKKFNAELFFGIPLTSRQKEGNWYVPITCDGIDGSAILNQARNFDAKRLTERIEKLKSEPFEQIRRSFLDFFSS